MDYIQRRFILLIEIHHTADNWKFSLVQLQVSNFICIRYTRSHTSFECLAFYYTRDQTRTQSLLEARKGLWIPRVRPSHNPLRVLISLPKSSAPPLFRRLKGTRYESGFCLRFFLWLQSTIQRRAPTTAMYSVY